MFVVALFMVCVLFGVESYANPSNERIIEDDFRRLMNAIAHNETEIFAKFIEAIEKSAQRSEENFNSTKDEVRRIQENRASRQHLSVDGRQHAATFKRDSGVQPVPVEQVQNIPVIRPKVENVRVIQQCLQLNGLPVNTALKDLEKSDLLQIVTCLLKEHESIKLGYTFVVLRGRIEADEARYSKGCTMRSDDLAKFLEINPAKLNKVGKKIVKLVEEFKTNNPGKEVVELKIEDFFHILDKGVIMQDSIATKALYHYFLWKYIFVTSTHEDILKLKEGKSPEEIDALCTDMSFMFVLSCGPVHLPPAPLVSIDKNDILIGLKLAHVKVSKNIKLLVDFLFNE